MSQVTFNTAVSNFVQSIPTDQDQAIKLADLVTQHKETMTKVEVHDLVMALRTVGLVAGVGAARGMRYYRVD